MALLAAMLTIVDTASAVARAEDPQARCFSLDQAVEFALAHHPALQISAAAEQASKARVDVARAQYLPRLEVSGQLTAGTGNVLRGGLFPMADIPGVSGPPTGRSLSDAAFGSAVGVAAAWDVLGLVVSMAQVDAALAANAHARTVALSQRFDVAYAAADQFLDLLSKQETARAARANLDRARVFDTTVRTLVTQELRPGADGARADVELALAENLLINAEQAQAASRHALSRALGIADHEVSIDAGKLLEAAAAELRPTPVTNPLLAQAAAAVRVEESRRRAASLTFMPRLEVIGAIWARGSGLTSGTLPPSSASGVLPDTPNMVAGLVFTVPLHAIATSLTQAQVASALVRQQEAAQADLTQAVEAQLRTALDTAAAGRRVVANTKTELAAATAAEAQAKARYQAGLANVVEVAEAQRLLAQAEIDDGVARVNVWRALLLVAHAVGDLSPFFDAVAHSE